MLGGLRLGAPGLLPADSFGDALVHSTTLGLASLRVPLEAGDVTGSLSPLTGAVVAVAAVAAGTRERRNRWTATRPVQVAAVAVALASLCALLAWAGRGAELRADVGGAALAGALWGSLGALLGTAERPAARFPGRAPATLLTIAAGLAGAWVVVVGAGLAVAGGVGLRALGGMALLVVAFAPNVAAALIALGCGARVDAAIHFEGGDLSSAGGVALWDWAGSAAPWYVLVLVAIPLTAATLAALVPPGPSLRRGLRSGLVLGGTLFVAGWAGAYEASRGVGPDGAAFRLGIDLGPVFALGVAWGLVGALVATVIERRSPRSRVTL